MAAAKETAWSRGSPRLAQQAPGRPPHSQPVQAGGHGKPAAPAATSVPSPAAAAAPGPSAASTPPGSSSQFVSGSSSSSASAPMPSMLGMLVSLRTHAGKEMTGELFALARGMAVIKTTRPHTYLRADVHVINLRAVAGVKLLGRAPDALAPTAALPFMDQKAVDARLKRTWDVMEAELASVGVGVSQQAQALFDRLNRIMSRCEWDGDAIVVHKTVRLVAPYQPADASTTASGQAASRTMSMVQRAVQRFWDEQAQ